MARKGHILFCLVVIASLLASTGGHSAPIPRSSFPAGFPGPKTVMTPMKLEASLKEAAIIASVKRKLEANVSFEKFILLQRNLGIEKSYRLVAEEVAREANERAEVAEASVIELIKGLEEAISETRAALSREEELKKKLAELEDSFRAKEGAAVEAESYAIV